MFSNKFTLKVIATFVVVFSIASCSDDQVITQAIEPPKVMSQNIVLDVYKSPSCGCCKKWISHINDNSFSSRVHSFDDFPVIKDEKGIEPRYRSCHTAISKDGYAFEGHVPAKFIHQFMQETHNDDVIGLSVPAMPVGSPGMEVGDKFQPYRVLLLKLDGSYETYANVQSYEEQFLMNKQNDNSKFHLKFSAGILAISVFYASAAQPPANNSITALSFEKAIKAAQKNDPWLTGNLHKQRAIELMSNAVNTLPNPKVSIGLANLPVNGFDFGQEGMTQAKVGISQMFPRGDSLGIKSQQLKIQSEAFPFQRRDRESKVAVTVGSLWLDAYRVQQSIALIEKNRSLFVQLVDVATVSYSSALGKTRQQDIVRAQLELTRLEDRLSLLAQQQNRYEGMLSQWLTQFSNENSSVDEAILASDFALHNIELTQQLPEIDLLNGDVVAKKTWLKPMVLVQYFANHPAVLAVEKQIDATKTGINLAQQKYKPEWGVNASYGYRSDDAMGSSRADLFSVGVTFDLPLFTENRQDNELKSAVSATEAVKTEKILLLRELLGAYSSAKGRLLRLKERQNLYTTRLLPQIHDQAEASLSAYTNDDGDFSEVVRSRIAVLNTEIDQLTLNVKEQKIRLELNYLFIGSLNNANTPNNINNSVRAAVASGNK